MTLTPTALGEAAQAHERYLWGLCYRMTGSAADAEDLVQQTYVRALEHPPSRPDAPLRPWLSSVAMHLSVDFLRRRKRAVYPGVWLPSPIETSAEPLAAVEPVLADGTSAEGRYDLLESVSFAFLLALEALTPQQRAVLLLRDVFDYSAKEAAQCLGPSEANAKTTLVRARRALASYGAQRCQPTHEAKSRTREALDALLGRLLEGDVGGLEALLGQEVRALSDGGGEFHAANVPVLGTARVATFMHRLVQMRGPPDGADIRELNGLPALIAWYSNPGPREAPRFIQAIRVDSKGQILELYSVLATRKLARLRFEG